jgi:hypothetical protein
MGHLAFAESDINHMSNLWQYSRNPVEIGSF